jgi:hypothetical protein
MRTQNKTKGALKHARKWDVVIWDWKEEAPVSALCKLSRQYPHSFEADLGDDNSYVFFSTFPITSNKQASDLINADVVEADQ